MDRDQTTFWKTAYAKVPAAHDTSESETAQAFQAILTQSSKVLELGCGLGHDALYLADHGHSITAVDISETSINKLRSISHARVEPVVHDIAKALPFEDSAFDGVFARLSLHYFSDRSLRAIMGEIARVLRSGGVLVALCKSDHDAAYGHGVSIEADMFDLDGHIRHFISASYAREILTRAHAFEGIEIVEQQINRHGKRSAVVQMTARRRASH